MVEVLFIGNLLFCEANSLNTYLLSAYYIADTVIAIKALSLNKTGKVSAVTILLGRIQTSNKYIS